MTLQVVPTDGAVMEAGMAGDAASYQWERIPVPAHETERLTLGGPGGKWVFTWARTGCLRVQRGDFTAYIPVEAIDVLRRFLEERP